MSWNPGNSILENYEDSEMKKNPSKVFRDLAPMNLPDPSKWIIKKEDIQDTKKNKKKNKVEEMKEKNSKKLLDRNIDKELTQIDNIDNPIYLKVETAEGKLAKSIECMKLFYQQNKEKCYLDIWLSYQQLYHQLRKEYKEDKNQHLKLNRIYRKYRKFISTIRKKVSGIDDILRYQLEEMSSYLPPLDYLSYYNKEFILDEWQKQAIQWIDEKKSILLCAPTSSGKTFLTTYLIKKSDRILFVVPTLPLALQVSAMFYQLGVGSIWLLDEDTTYKSSSQPKIIIGTPNEIIRRIEEIEISSITSLVIDEIHEININYSVELIIHIMLNQLQKVQFLGLSATIGNPQEFKSWLSKFIKDIKLIYVNQRFFNLSRYIYNNNQVSQITPLHTLNVEDIITKNNIEYPFTPKNCIYMMDKMLEYGFEFKTYQEYFDKNERITLNQTKLYSQYLIDILKNQNKDDIIKFISTIQNEIQDKNIKEIKETNNNNNNNNNIYQLATYLSEHQITPSIIFHLDTIQLKQYFDELQQNFIEKEKEKYPDYQIKQQKKMDKYLTTMKEREKTLSTITNENKKLEWERDHPEPICPDAVGTPHPEFCLKTQGEPISINDIKEIKDKLYQEFMDKNMETLIPKLLELFSALLRGIAIYTQDLPTLYLRCVQQLTQQGKVAVLLSDKSLAFGINMPIKTVCFYQDTPLLDTLMYQQMEGRCGRRGMDKNGNVFFCGFEYNRIKELVNGKIIPIQGNKNIIDLNTLTIPEIENKEVIINNIQHHNLNKIQFTNNIIDKYQQQYQQLGETEIPLYWELSKYKNAYYICMFMKWIKPNKILHLRNNDNDDILFFSLICSVIEIEETHIENDKIDYHKLFEKHTNKLIIRKLPEYLEKINVNYDMYQLNNCLFNIFKLNSIPDKYKQDTILFNGIKTRLKNANMIMLILRNYYRKTSMEIILRKVWRRLYWICKTISIY